MTKISQNNHINVKNKQINEYSKTIINAKNKLISEKEQSSATQC